MKPRSRARGLAAAALVLSATALAAQDDRLAERHMPDVDELRGLRNQNDSAAQWLVEGERSLAQGRVEKAAELFAKAATAAPNSALVARRHCQALAELGRHGAAIDACRRALSLRPTPMASRAMVAALLSAKPNTTELSQALGFAEQLERTIPNEPWGYAARCDVARALGDQTMLQTCVNDLQRVAPGHHETERALATLRAQTPGRGVWLGWFVLAAMLLGTGAHAAWRALGRRRHAPVALGALLLASLGAVSSPSRADEAPAQVRAGGFSKWPVDDADPVKSLPTAADRDRDPLNFGYHLMDLTERAEGAVKRGDFASAARFYEAMVGAVPDEAIGYRKACDLYEKSSNRTKALEFCRGALGVSGATVADSSRYVELVVSQPGAISKEQSQDIADVIRNLRAVPNTELALAKVECDLAVRLEDAGRLERCSTVLAKAAPNAASTLSYRWNLALLRQDFAQAEHFALLAKQAAVPAAVTDRMLQQVQEQRSLKSRLARLWQAQGKHLISALTLAALVGALSWIVLRRRSSPARTF